MRCPDSMKKLLIFTLLILSSFSALAQQEEILKGKIQIDSLEAPVHIINKKAETGILSDENGEFQIKARPGDVLLISSVQYERKEIRITPEILKKGLLEVQLSQDYNRLDEVRLTELTGNLRTDLDKLEIVEMPVINIGPVPLEPQMGVDNAAMAESTGHMASGGNILGLVGLIAGNRNLGKFPAGKDENTFTKRKANKFLRAKFETSFFTDHLKIQLPYINDFIDYSFEHGLSESMFRNDRSLDLIVFLEARSKSFLKEISEEENSSEMPG